MEHDTQSTPDSMFRLIVLGDGSVRTIPLLGSRWIIGRAPECTVPLRDPTVSRRHIGLERHGECFRFQDLGGSNPILLDGRPVSQGILDVGQTLLIGLTRLTLERRRPSAVIVPDSSATIMLAREVIERYRTLKAEERIALFHFLATELQPDGETVARLWQRIRRP